MTATLMMIDIQVAGDDPSLGRRGQPEAEANAARLLAHWRSLGNPIIHTPNIDRMASEGTLFEHAFVTTAICMTSRASILTGQYAARHKIWDFGIDFTPDQLRNTYLGQLNAAGYRTGFIGKWGWVIQSKQTAFSTSIAAFQVRAVSLKATSNSNKVAI